MKKNLLNCFLSLSTLLAAPFLHGQSLTWDANGTGTGQTNGAGAWLGTNLWWNGTANQDWVSGSDAIFGGASGAGGAVTLASPTSAGSITFNTFTGTYTLGTAGQAITLNNGITKSANSGAVTIVSPITLGGSQMWTNNSTNKLQISSFLTTSLGQTLTLAGTGEFNFPTTTTGITGDGSIIVDGAYLNLISGGNQAANSYTGTTTVQNGGEILYYQNGPNIGTGNITLNGGILAGYYNQGFTRAFGTASGQFQISGGVSGFGVNGANTINFSNVTSVQWGSASFDPSKFVLGGGRSGGTVTFAENIDLNNANRIVTTNVGGVLSGVLSTSSGTAGLIKEGAGTLTLSNTNTYNGNTTVSEGTLTANTIGALPGFDTTGRVTVAASATLAVRTAGWTAANIDSLRGATSWSDASSHLGFDTSGGSFTYGSNITEALSVAKIGTNTLTLTGNNSYTGRTRVHAGTLSFNSIANVGAGSSALGAPTTAANGTINIGSGGTAATITYTGSGHSTDRVINLSGSTGGATIDASGAGPLALTSSLTATGVGAKTLTLTGTNTANNTLGSSAIPGLADVLTITKSGAGTWWVNGFSSPKNAWSVTAGTLVLAGTTTTGDQQVTVSGGTLAGTGPITLQSGKLLTIQAAGSLAPGNLAVGNLALTGNLSVSAMAAGTGKLNFQIGAPAASDKITVTGNAQIGTGVLGFSDFIFTDMGGITPGTYILISTTAGITGTLDPANRSGLIGTINGTLQINGNNLEWSTDQDLDGIPDVYELANTTPPSATAFNPGDDLDTDGSTNLQEYIAGTNPNNPDSDADGFNDGHETNTGIWVSLTNTGTNPLLLDTDGDTIRDGYEKNTGIWVGATNTGTNPNKPDSDSDSLNDNVENNTGTFVSKTNTGTDPNDSDTDNDNTGDWYEITASFTSPFLASEKPDVPYPLPDPDTSTGATNKPVKVYIMSGQSNMVGFGTRDGTEDKSLETMTLRQNKFPDLINSSGAWTTRQDVHYRGVISDFAKVQLSPGNLAATFGPELGFGYVMGWYHDEPILLLKSCTGNRSLGWDVLPHGSPGYQYGGYEYAAYGQSSGRWLIGSTPPAPWVPGNWYAGKEFDRFFKHESEWINPDTADFNAVDVLDNFAAEYPDWAAQGFEIAGFVWWQGDKDRYDLGHATRYEHNLVNLITSLRSYYENRYNNDQNGLGQPNNLTKTLVKAPFVLATLGQTPLTSTDPAEKPILDGMLAVDGESGEYTQFAGNVKTVYAHPLSEGGASNSHYNGRAGTYMLVGDALGRAMVDLESNVTPSTGFATWAATFPTLTNTDASFDFDKGGLETGIEWVLGGNPTSGADDSGLAPTIDRTTDPNGKLLFIFRRTTAAGADANTAINVEYGSSLNGWTTAVHQGTAANQITITSQTNGFGAGIDKVTVALPPSLADGGKIFARLKVAVTSP